MLARDAENLYWMGRYLERAENNARLIINTTDTLLDLPEGASLGWDSLLQIAGIDMQYKQHFGEANETDIMHFLIADERNFSSVFSCVKAARENARTLRESLPEETWENINSLYLYIVGNLKKATVDRRSKYLFLNEVITKRFVIIGAITSLMEYDQAYQFIKIGTNIERADMVSRIIDLNFAVQLPEDSPMLEVTLQTLWMGILKTLSALQIYRRIKAIDVNKKDVIEFLYHEDRFPRSISHCLGEIELALASTPKKKQILESVKLAKSTLKLKNAQKIDDVKLHEHIDIFQQYLGNIHHALNTHYFRAYDDVNQAGAEVS